MKKEIVCRRVCMYDVLQEKVVAILSDCYNSTLSDRDIMTLVYNPYTMERVNLPFHEELWIKNSNIRIEIINEYREVEQWFDKFVRWFK